MKTILKTSENILTFKELLNNFVLSAQVEGKSERILELYNEVLIYFYGFIKKEPENITTNDVRAYLNELNQKGYAKTTIWAHYKELKIFFNFCFREGYSF